MDDFLSQALSNSTSPLIEDILPIEDVDTDSCQLLGPVALAVQGVMGFIVIGGLLIKRMRERPRRKWKIWLADVGKQVVGQFIVHLSNVAISDLIASNRSDNPCSLYALNILIDTTLGVLLLYFLLQYSTLLMQRFQPLYKTGFYGTPFSMSLWAEQAAVYVGCLAVMKIVVLIIFWIAPELEDGMSWGLSWIENEEAQVVIVMLILPLVMNLFQFLMVDSIIRSKDPASPSVVNQESDEEALRRGFLETGSDDEDDDLNEERQQRLGNGNSAQQRSRDGEYEDVTGGDEDESGRQKQATELLFDADSPMVQQIPMMTMSRDNRASSKIAYPPTSVNLSYPLPPYSTLPPPDTLRESPGNSPKQTNRDSIDGEGKDDDGWGDQWDASSDIEEEEKLSQVPSPPSHPLACTSRSPPPLSPPAGSPPIPQPSQPRTRSSSPPASRFFSPDESGTSTPQRTPPRNPIADNTQWLANASAREREVESSQSTGLTAIEDHDQGRSDEEEADWGFSPPPVPPPELHVMPSTPSPRASGDFDWLSSPEIPPSILNQEPTTSIQSNRLEQEEKVRKDQDQEKEEEEEEEEEDLWGFDDSLSNDAPPSPVPSSLPDSSSAVERVLGLNEEVVDVAPQIRAPSEVGKELGGLS